MEGAFFGYFIEYIFLGAIAGVLSGLFEGCFVITIWLYASANIFRSNRLKGGPLPESVENTGAKPDSRAFLGLQRYSITILVCMGLSGGIALLGFILCLLGDDKQIVYLFVAISGVAIMILRPKPEEYEHYQT